MHVGVSVCWVHANLRAAEPVVLSGPQALPDSAFPILQAIEFWPQTQQGECKAAVAFTTVLLGLLLPALVLVQRQRPSPGSAAAATAGMAGPQGLWAWLQWQLRWVGPTGWLPKCGAAALLASACMFRQRELWARSLIVACRVPSPSLNGAEFRCQVPGKHRGRGVPLTPPC